MAINRTGIRMIDGPRTSFCVPSRSETESFPRTWRLRASRVCFAPWPVTLSEQELRRPAAENGRVFAGGNSLRDYGPLIAAATEIDAPIDIATSALGVDDLGRPPANVTVGPVAQAEYDRMMLSASVIVVPLQSRLDRSSGQTTYVNAMARGKAVVVTDAPGVRDYVEEGQTGLIVAPGDRDGLARAVRRLLDDPEERRQIGWRAREHALSRLSLTHYATRLLDVVDETLSSPAPGRTSRGAPPADGLAARF
jgi:glycosyltransferase involved in cell wall biosynthesis